MSPLFIWFLFPLGCLFGAGLTYLVLKNKTSTLDSVVVPKVDDPATVALIESLQQQPSLPAQEILSPEAIELLNAQQAAEEMDKLATIPADYTNLH